MKTKPTDEQITKAFRALESAQPDACDLIDQTAKAIGVKPNAVMDALEREAERVDAEKTTAGKPSRIMPGLRPELFSDVAGQFERMEQVCSLQWMQNRNVTLAEVQALSRELAALIRRHLGEPSGKSAVGPSETVLGARHSAAFASENQTTK